MNKQTTLKAVNIALFLSFAAQAVTGIVMGAGLNVPFSGLFYGIHEFNGMLTVILAVAHLALNWAWVKSAFFRKRQAS